MKTYEFKKFKYYFPKCKAIHRLSFNSQLYKLAVSRSDNTLEIWDLKDIPHIDRIFYTNKDDTIEGIVWCDDRLFTAGSSGAIIEWDLLNLNSKLELSVTSGPCWCISINKEKKLLAAGTEDGYVNVIQIFGDTLMHEKLLDKQEGRIICIAWEESSNFIVTGSIDAVRVWNVQTGHAVHKLNPGRSEVNKCTVIWCLAVTNDFTIISGDSRGKLIFWDGHQGLQIDSQQTHKADILSICLNENQTKLYCAGTDPLIASFEKINIRSSGMSTIVNYKWIKSIQRVIHDYVVKALVMCDEKLFSGGADGYLALSSYPPKILIKYSPLQSKRISFADKTKMLLVSYDEHLEVWNWSAKFVLSHVALIKSYKNQHIRCSTISSDSSWIVYSTDNVLRLLRFCAVKNPINAEIKRLSNIPNELKSVAVCLCFSPNNQYLVIATKMRNINIFELKSDDSVHFLYTLNTDTQILTDTIHLISLSPDCEYMVLGDRSSNIAVWKEFQFHCSLPVYNSAPTAMAINHYQNNVVVSYADHKIVEFDIEKKKYTSFSRALGSKHPKQWLNRQFHVDGILFDRLNNDVIMIYDDTTICIIDKSKKLPEIGRKIPRLDTVKSPENSDNSESDSGHFILSRSDNIAFHILKEFKHLVYLNMYNDNELLAVEVLPDKLLSDLPRTSQKNLYGIL